LWARAVFGVLAPEAKNANTQFEINHLDILSTGARWPNFRPNKSKEAAKNCPWPEKIGGRKMAEFGKKWQKRGRKIFLQIFR
jgi:hypothetical protein